MSHLQTSGQPLSFTIKYKEQVLSLGEKYKSRHGHSRHNTVDLRLHLDNYQSNNGHKQNQGGSNAGIFLEPKCRNKKAQFGMSTSRSWEQQRVPIYYSEEESFVPQGKVVYQGYTPKNSYYCLRTMKEQGGKQWAVSHENDLQFDSKFESGNLSRAVRVSRQQYWLFMRQDTNTHGLRQWYYFKVGSNRALTVRFRIYKFTKRHSLYSAGMRPYVKTQEGRWGQAGENVSYCYDSDSNCFYLSFDYCFGTEKCSVQMASLPPYTYSMLTGYANRLAGESTVKVSRIGRSLAGLDIPLIAICSSNIQSCREYFGDKRDRKRAIVVMARTHPSETCSNYTLEAFVQKLLTLPQLLSVFDFFLLPMLNPDGVYLGNHRTGVSGVDLNRKFNVHNQDLYPEIDCARQLVQHLQSTSKVQFLLDLHGHSASRNIFAYGEEHEPGGHRYLKSRILPKILSETLSTFKYSRCVFRRVRQKQHTARVYFSNRHHINSLTFEQSFGLIDGGPIGIPHWRNFGSAIAEALLEYLRLRKLGITAIESYLANEIQADKSAVRRRQQMELAKKEMDQQEDRKGNQKQPIDKVQPDYLQTPPVKDRTRIGQTNNVASIETAQGNVTRVGQTVIGQDLDAQGLDKQYQNEQCQNEQCQNAQDMNLSNNSSLATSELSSGDQQLQLREEESEQLQEEIRKGWNRQAPKREPYGVSANKIELHPLFHWSQEPILHDHKMSIAPRILKMQMNQRRQSSLELLELLISHPLPRKQSRSQAKQPASPRKSPSPCQPLCLPVLKRYLH